MDALALEMSILNDEYKLSMITLEHEMFMSCASRLDNEILNEGVIEVFKKFITSIKEKLIELKNKFFKVLDFIKNKIKEFSKNLKRESINLTNNAKGKINPNEKINISDNTIYDIPKLSSWIDKMNNNYKQKIQIATVSCSRIISFLNSGKFNNVAVEINASKDKLPVFNEYREKLLRNEGKLKIDDEYIIKKDEMSGAEFIKYCNDANSLESKATTIIDSIFDINKQILDPAIKSMDKLLVKDINRIADMNIQELNFNRELSQWLMCMNRWIDFGLGYGKAILQAYSQATKSVFITMNKFKSIRVTSTNEETVYDYFEEGVVIDKLKDLGNLYKFLFTANPLPKVCKVHENKPLYNLIDKYKSYTLQNLNDIKDGCKQDIKYLNQLAGLIKKAKNSDQVVKEPRTQKDILKLYKDVTPEDCKLTAKWYNDVLIKRINERIKNKEYKSLNGE